MKKLNLPAQFTLAGILIGFLVGLCEGSFILLHHRHIRLNQPSVGSVILFLAPCVDALGYGLLGGFLGSIAVLTRGKVPGRTHYFVAPVIALAGAQLVYMPAHAWIRWGKFPSLMDAGMALTGGVILTLAVLRYWPIAWSYGANGSGRFWPPSLLFIRSGTILAGLVMVGWLASRMMTTGAGSKSHLPSTNLGRSGNQPNIILIALDAARADHFSAYGYDRPTTPNLDRLARQGVLFETAIAPAPWTLPSFAAVFTGLLPHQNQANWETPLPKGSSTLASILGSRGYQTVGFNANYLAGTARTGLAEGFDYYNDDDRSLRTDFASLGLVMAFWRLVYCPFFRADYLPRRDAGTLNDDVFGWLGHQDARPLFLFINYFDAHEPYDAVPAVGNRFGDARKTFTQRVRAEADNLTAEIEVPRTPAEQGALIAGYDSGLAYADSQIGSLLQLLQASPEWSNTYVIVFGDHGQSFGTHRHYGHGWGLNWELLHVPLILAGPGIPHGRRVRNTVGLRQLFGAILDLSSGGRAAMDRNSLRCAWTLSPALCDSAPMVISELVMVDPPAEAYSSSISAVTPGRHLIRDAAGALQLYDLASDPGEEVNLAGSADHQDELAALQNSLFERVRASSRPWLGEGYLWALGERQFSLLAAQHMVHAKWPSLKPRQPSAQDNELLHSLPYQ